MDKIKYYLLSILLYGALIFTIVGLTEDHRDLTIPAGIEEATTEAAVSQGIVFEETRQ